MRLPLSLSFVLAAACATSNPVDKVPQTDVVKSARLAASVEVVRDEHGIPHIFGASFADVAFAQGYLQAQDRLVQLDLARHLAEGRLAEIAGDLSASIIDRDIGMRVHHLQKTAADAFAQLQASSAPEDKMVVEALGRFADGVNLYLSTLKAGDAHLPPQLAFAYSPANAPPWTEVDSLAIGRLLAFQQSYSVDGDIARSAIDAAAAARFESATDDAHKARKAIARDFGLLAPIDPTYTLPGGFGALSGSASAPAPASLGGEALALLRADRPILVGVGLDRIREPMRGSNNWTVGPSLSATGRTMVANDPHLSLGNPPTFYLVHLVVRGGPYPLDVFGASIPGVPGVVLGMNRHIAWAATDSYVDTADVYKETIVQCDNGAGPCVMFKGAKVPLVPRVESFGIGRFGEILSTKMVTYYDVPHHGPLLPRIAADHTLEALGSSELSVRFTGYDLTQEVRALFGVDRAASMKEAVAALDRDFKFGGFNWVIGDDQGHFGWTETNRIPRRAAGSVPWKVLPGDGSAEWGGDLDGKYIPHAFDPAMGFLVTANNDPIGITDGDDPLGSAPMVDGAPVYVGADYDAGTRVGRITKRLQAASAAGKISLDEMQSIQADAVSEIGELLTPTLLDAARALDEEIAAPGAHPELAASAAAAVATGVDRAAALAALAGWSFDTPSATDGEQPTAQQLLDSRATVLFNMWMAFFSQRAIGDESAALGEDPGESVAKRILVKMCLHPDKLATGLSSTGDSILFDDMTTPAIESKRQIAAAAYADALAKIKTRLGTDPGGWRWGKLHTLALEPVLPLDKLRIPLASDAAFPGGFPRHGDNGTVDVGDHGFSPDDFSYAHGPQVRFVAELTPSGPRARTTLPGGEVFDPASPHYRDLIELWRKNQTFDIAFSESDVVTSALKEKAATGVGRVHFAPK